MKRIAIVLGVVLLLVGCRAPFEYKIYRGECPKCENWTYSHRVIYCYADGEKFIKTKVDKCKCGAFLLYYEKYCKACGKERVK